MELKQYLFIHGKNAELSKAELAVFFLDWLPRDEVSCYKSFREFTWVKSSLPFGQAMQDALGGTIKICEVIEGSPVDAIIAAAKTDKILFGVSQYGGHEKLSQVLISLKRELRTKGHNARFLNKDFKNVSSGQLNKSDLMQKGIDLTRVWMDGKETWAQTICFQDIDAYSKRDYEKPKRDMKVGMLPPKLAQIMINLAQPSFDTMVYDPFCGLGTVLIEGLLRGNKIAGSDIKGAMVGATEKNVGWLFREFQKRLFERLSTDSLEAPPFPKTGSSEELKAFGIELFQHDATQAFPQGKKLPEDVVVVSEGYLGPPQSSFPNPKTQKEIFELLDGINSHFFSNISQIIKSGKKLVFCFPFFRGKQEKVFYPEEMIRSYAEHNGFEIEEELRSLLYERKTQVVGREVVVMRKK